MPRYDTVSFLSDYGLADEFVGVVKAVIRDLAPHVAVIDLTHEIPPHDIRWRWRWPLHPVRPVGRRAGRRRPRRRDARRALAVEIAGGAGVVVAPDNGLIALRSPWRAARCGGRAHQHRVPPGRTGGHAAAGTCSPRGRTALQRVRWPSSERRSTLRAGARCDPGATAGRRRGRGRGAGSTTSGTRSSTSGRRTWPVGTASPASVGGRGQDGHRRHHLRRDRAGCHRARARLLRPARGVIDAAVGGRRARVGGGTEIRLSPAGAVAPQSARRRLTMPVACGRPTVPASGRGGLAPCAPPRRSPLALLLVAIVVAGVISLVMIG